MKRDANSNGKYGVVIRSEYWCDLDDTGVYGMIEASIYNSIATAVSNPVTIIGVCSRFRLYVVAYQVSLNLAQSKLAISL